MATLLQTPSVAGQPLWWHWLIFGIIMIVFMATLLPVIARWQRGRRQRIYHLELENTGNIPGVYLLRAEDTAEGLQYEFALSGRPLPDVEMSGETMMVTAPAGNAPQPLAAPKPAKPKSKSKLAFVGSLANLGAFIGRTLTTIGNALPYSVGLPLLRLGGRLSQGQRLAMQVQHGPHQLNAAKQVSRQFQKQTGSASTTTATPTIAPGTSVTAGQVAVSIGPLVSWKRAPKLGQGKRMDVELRLSPLRPHAGSTYYFTVVSRREEDAAALVRVEETCYFPPLTWAERYGPFVALLLLLVAALRIFLWFW